MEGTKVPTKVVSLCGQPLRGESFYIHIYISNEKTFIKIKGHPSTLGMYYRGKIKSPNYNNQLKQEEKYKK